MNLPRSPWPYLVLIFASLVGIYFTSDAWGDESWYIIIWFPFMVVAGGSVLALFLALDDEFDL